MGGTHNSRVTDFDTTPANKCLSVNSCFNSLFASPVRGVLSTVVTVVPPLATQENNTSSYFGCTMANGLLFRRRSQAQPQTECHGESEVYREPIYWPMVSTKQKIVYASLRKTEQFFFPPRKHVEDWCICVDQRLYKIHDTLGWLIWRHLNVGCGEMSSHGWKRPVLCPVEVFTRGKDGIFRTGSKPTEPYVTRWPFCPHPEYITCWYCISVAVLCLHPERWQLLSITLL